MSTLEYNIWKMKTKLKSLIKRSKIPFSGLYSLYVLLTGFWDLKDEIILKIKWSVKTLWHERMEVSRARLSAPDIYENLARIFSQ